MQKSLASFGDEEVERRSKEIKEVSLSLDSHPSFIGAWMLDDMSVCDDLIKLHNSQFEELGNIGVSNTTDGEEIIDKSIKNSLDLPLPVHHPINYKYSVELQKVLLAYIAKYPRVEHVARFEIEAANIQKYPKGGGYHQWHTERNGLFTSHRHLVYMTYLNDISDGGETEFLYQKLKVKPRKGLTLIWPVDWTHTHRGLPSMTEEKCIATGWYDFVGEKDGN